MYTDYFSLIEKPFSITPDPAYLFLSKRHEEALAHLLYGVTDSGGFIQLTGEVGTGKTTIIRSLFGRVPEHVEIALILNPRMSESEFLHAICDELLITVTPKSSNKECFDALNSYLLDAHSQGQKVVLMIDEAQNLAVSVLEYIRLLTNLETDKEKLLQIILVGQPELKTLLQRQDLRQLAQRITARYQLAPLNKAESGAYIGHRLRVAGTDTEIFTKAAKNKIYSAAKGIPRLINVLCDRALLGAYSQEESKVDRHLAKRVISEVLGEDNKPEGVAKWLKFIPITLMLAFGGVMLGQWFMQSDYFPGKTKTVPQLSETKPSAVASQFSDAIEVASKPVEKIKVETKTIAIEKPAASPVRRELQSLTAVLANNINETTAEKNIQKLLSLWNREQISSVENICEKIKSQNLRCLFRNAQWRDLVNVNRPVILELRDAKNTLHHLLLKHADNKNALVQIADQELLVPLNEIIAAWRGDYLLFWQPDHQAFDASLQLGSTGSDVLWLKQSLRVLNVLPSLDVSNSYFNSTSKQQVQSFQRENGLLVDGVVGRETFIAINNALNLGNRPKLMRGNLLEGGD